MPIMHIKPLLRSFSPTLPHTDVMLLATFQHSAKESKAALMFPNTSRHMGNHLRCPTGSETGAGRFDIQVTYQKQLRARQKYLRIFSLSN